MPQIPAPCYIYQPLCYKDSIRVLELLPGIKGSPLQCNITEVRRRDTPKYEALSYAWGEPVFPHQIEEVASGTHLNITLNLFIALQGIRYEETPRLLWIDAICINQLELKEKSHQVASMGNIYEDAWRVVVWLGHHKGAATKIVDLLKHLTEMVQWWKQERGTAALRRISQALIRLRYLQFFQQPWYESNSGSADMGTYNRLWVAQEFILAKTVQFMAADDRIPFDILHSAVRDLAAVSTGSRELHDSAKGVENQDLLASIQSLSQLFLYRERRQVGHEMKYLQQAQVLGNKEPGSSLIQCFSELCIQRECKDDRDRIYGILAFSRDDLGITVNYDLPIHVVYNDFATRSLLAGNLSVLHLSGVRPDRQPELKSFAPDLSNRDSMTCRFNVPELGGHASTKSSVSIRVRRDGLPVILGMKIDLIHRAGDTSIDKLNLFAWCVTPLRLSHKLPVIWNINKSRKDNSQHRELERCTQWKINALGLGVERVGLLKNRHVFQTGQGYIGFGPFWMQPGDQIVMFDGGVTPFIIRRNIRKDNQMSDTWLHVGDCYLHGWMDGEYFGHTVINNLPPEEEELTGLGPPADDDEICLVREWFTLV